MQYFNVYINKIIYTYQSSKRLAVGMEVLVPLRNKKISGFIVKKVDKPNFVTKEIIEIVRKKPQFSEDMVETAEWISNYYKSYLAKALELIMPRF